MRCLYDVGFPLLSHIHTGNIFIEVDEEWKEVCRLGGYENTLLGYRTLNYKKIFEGGHLNKIDVIMFGKFKIAATTKTKTRTITTPCFSV